MSMPSWPVAEIDAIQKLRVLAASVPGAVVAEATIDAPFERVWAVAADLERELPTYLRDVRSFRITKSDGERLEAHARGYVGLRARFDIVLKPGWCVMRSRFLVGAMAAMPADDGAATTRFAFLGGVHIPGQLLAASVLRSVGKKAGPAVLRRFAQRVG